MGWVTALPLCFRPQPPQPLAATSLLSVLVALPLWNRPCKWNHRACDLPSGFSAFVYRLQGSPMSARQHVIRLCD